MAIAEIKNSIFTIQECSNHEVVAEMKLYISLKDHQYEVDYYHYSIYGVVQSGS